MLVFRNGVSSCCLESTVNMAKCGSCCYSCMWSESLFPRTSVLCNMYGPELYRPQVTCLSEIGQAQKNKCCKSLLRHLI